MAEIRLSIIIPFYNTLKLTKELLDILAPQLTDEIEVLLINDGGDTAGLELYSVKIIDTCNGGVSRARNIGLDNSIGKYIAFIDSDDKVSSDYIDIIMKKMEGDWDYCYIGWRAVGSRFAAQFVPGDEFQNDNYYAWWSPSVWSCIYKKSLIGNARFNEDKVIAEDVEFSSRVRKGKRAIIKDIIYYYNTSRGNSLSDLHMKGSISEEYKSLKALYSMEHKKGT